jgi:hypothetical protein|tara:strand:- start:712 stop:1176 length:465 start_codon:yes stop_codon:yes gene_type:complete
VPFCAGFFFFFASPDEEGANVVAVFFTNLFKFLSNAEDDDDVEAEAEEDVVESLSPVAIVAFSLSSFVAFTTTCPWTKDDCSFRGNRIDDDALRLFPFKAFEEDKEDFGASASFLQFDEDETLRDDPLHNIVVKVVVVVFALVFTLRARDISVL